MQVDFNTLPDTPAYGPIPLGTYPFQVTKLTQKNWPDGQPKGVTVEHTIEGPKFSGRKVFEFFYLMVRDNDPDKAKRTYEINAGRLKRLATACGFTPQQPMTNTNQLMGRRALVRVGFAKKKNEQGELENEVKDWERPQSANGPPVAPQAALATQQPVQQPPQAPPVGQQPAPQYAQPYQVGTLPPQAATQAASQPAEQPATPAVNPFGPPTG